MGTCVGDAGGGGAGGSAAGGSAAGGSAEGGTGPSAGVGGGAGSPSNDTGADDSGCSCRLADSRSRPTTPWAVGMLGVALALVRRRNTRVAGVVRGA